MEIEKMDLDKTVGEERQVACEVCDNTPYHRVLKSVNRRDEGDWGLLWRDMEIIECQGCKTISFRKAWGTDEIDHEDEQGNWVYENYETLYPSRQEGRRSLRGANALPVDVQKIYEETHQAVLSGQSILAGMGIRALVESVCREKSATGGNLEGKIKSLVSMGVLTKDGADILDFTRLFGNDAAHRGLQIKAELLVDLIEIAENLLTNVYLLPKKLHTLQKERESRQSSIKSG